MTAAAKSPGRTSSRPTPEPPAPAAPTSGTGRKPWKKKTPVEIFAGQLERLRTDVQEKEEELKQAKSQLQKLEEAMKLLESA